MKCKGLEDWFKEMNISYHAYNSSYRETNYILTNTKVLEGSTLKKISECGAKVAVNPKGYIVVIDKYKTWE